MVGQRRVAKVVRIGVARLDLASRSVSHQRRRMRAWRLGRGAPRTEARRRAACAAPGHRLEPLVGRDHRIGAKKPLNAAQIV
jgi:hypothetical protein